MTLLTYLCKTCNDPFKARKADRDRGWARYCSKSCKAIRQTQKTGVGKGGYIYLPNGGSIKRGYEYDKYGAKVGFQMGLADLNDCQG